MPGNIPATLRPQVSRFARARAAGSRPFSISAAAFGAALWGVGEGNLDLLIELAELGCALIIAPAAFREYREGVEGVPVKLAEGQSRSCRGRAR
jgi:hypothetical protein